MIAAQSPVSVRHLRGRRGQPAGRHRGARGRGVSGAVYNPLFVYSRSGLGKTHLLDGHRASAPLELNPQLDGRVPHARRVRRGVPRRHRRGAGRGVPRSATPTWACCWSTTCSSSTDRRGDAGRAAAADQRAAERGTADRAWPATARPPRSPTLDERLIPRFAGGPGRGHRRPRTTKPAWRSCDARRRSAKADFDPGVLEAVATLPSRQRSRADGRTQPADRVPGGSEAAHLADALALLRGAREPVLPPALGGRGGRAVRRKRRGRRRRRLGATSSAPFLSEISLAVARQVEAWRGRVAEAIAALAGRGVPHRAAGARCSRSETPVDPETVHRATTRTISSGSRRCRPRRRNSIRGWRGDRCFRDPDRMAEARSELADAPGTGWAPPPGPVADLARWRSSSSRALATGSRCERRASVLERPGQQLQPAGRHRRQRRRARPTCCNAHGQRARRGAGCRWWPACGPQDFVDELIAAIERDRVDRWRARYRRVTALLLDDVQLLAGKDRTQEELFCALQPAGRRRRQLVFASRGRRRTSCDRDRRAASDPARGWAGGRDAGARIAKCARRCWRGCCGTGPAPDGAELAELPRRPAGRTGARRCIGLVQRVLGRRGGGRSRPPPALAREVLEGEPGRPARGPPAAAPAGCSRRPASSEPGEDGVGLARHRRPSDRGARADGDQGQPQGGQPSRRAAAARAGQEDRLSGVADRQNFGYIYFDKGRICYASIVNRRDRIGDMLVKTGLITQAQLDAAIAAGRPQRDKRLGEILVERARDPARSCTAASACRSRRRSIYLFTWNQGTFNFEADVAPERAGLPRLDQSRVAAARGCAPGGRVEPDREEDPELRHGLRGRSGDAARRAGGRARPRRSGDPAADRRQAGRAGRSSTNPAWSSSRSGRRCTASSPPATCIGSARGHGRSPGAADARVKEHRNLGVAFYKTGMLDEAHREFRRVLELSPDDPGAPFYLGLMRRSRTRWPEAVERAAARPRSAAGRRAAALHNLAFALRAAGSAGRGGGGLRGGGRQGAGRIPGRAGMGQSPPCSATTSRWRLSRLARTRGSCWATARCPPPGNWAMALATAGQGDLRAGRPVAPGGDHAASTGAGAAEQPRPCCWSWRGDLAERRDDAADRAAGGSRDPAPDLQEPG